jgi:hypothetical protein
LTPVFKLVSFWSFGCRNYFQDHNIDLPISTEKQLCQIDSNIVAAVFILAAIRVDVGGKLLTNHLKEIISYRQIHVLEETYVMNACKEDACFVSLDFDRDLRMASEDSKVRIKKNAAASEGRPGIYLMKLRFGPKSLYIYSKNKMAPINHRILPK